MDMSQQISASAIQQPQKLRKNFCFATIPFIFIAIFTLYSSIFLPISNLSHGFNGLYLTGTLIYTSGYLLFFFGSVLLTALLFKKTYRAVLGVPLFLLSAGYMLQCAAQIPFSLDIYFEHGNITVLDSLLTRLHFILILLAASAAFLTVSVYVFIVTSRKKPAPRVLWIIPAILFCLLYAPQIISSMFFLIRYVFNNLIYILLEFPSYLFMLLFPVAIILLLIWVSFPYKKDKSQKTSPVQPAPASAHVMPKPVAAPVMPAVENKLVENGQTKPLFGTVDMSVNTDEEVTVDPVMRQFTSPVQPVSKPVEDDPERTIDYSYAEAFYPPVNAPADKPEVKAKTDLDSEVNKQQTVMKLLTEYKKLLDSGVITQEDYDKKKNELLGL